MSPVESFRQTLRQKSQAGFATWHRVDLHNHSPQSFDYRGVHETAIEDSAKQILARDLSVVMFTDHGTLPTSAFTSSVAAATRKLILRGTELNVFVDAWGKPANKVEKNAFFHLLVGFDPDSPQGPDYWMAHLRRRCQWEARASGSQTIEGIASPIETVLDELEEANAIVIPAHLHSTRDAFKSRSIDDIYADARFLSLIPRLSAIEVTDPKTAAFFDGAHAETGNAEIGCIQSSDAHAASELGWRATWVQLQHVSFAELKAALELRWRISLGEPQVPDSYFVGIHVDGQYLRDFWMEFSPHCNILIGVKGAGKTSVLECLRFVIGANVPKGSRDQVGGHLSHILGPAGRVEVLLKRKDGGMVLCERSIANDSKYKITFEDGRQEVLNQVSALNFVAQILGWHEIEHAATDVTVRRRYLDDIAGATEVEQFRRDAMSAAEQIKLLHEQAASRYRAFRNFEGQARQKEQIRRGLQELRDQDLIELRDKYEHAVSHRQGMQQLLQQVREVRKSVSQRTRDIVALPKTVLPGGSPLEAQASKFRPVVARLHMSATEIGTQLEQRFHDAERELAGVLEEANTEFATFATTYEQAIAGLDEAKRKLLESHRQVLDQTRDLPALQSQRDDACREVEALLGQLIAECSRVTKLLNDRSSHRQRGIDRFLGDLRGSGVNLAMRRQNEFSQFDEWSSKNQQGREILNQLVSQHSDVRTFHERLKKTYEGLRANLIDGFSLFFDHAEFSGSLVLLEDDDLTITFDADGNGKNHRPIDQLSAGQRCTAIFPLILKLRNGPLVIDQPEDNLDNRHIASKICPTILTDKRNRQIIMTSHNANLVVLSDAECIALFESRDSHGLVQEQGFLAMRSSPITKHVLEVLDGGGKGIGAPLQEIRFCSARRRANQALAGR